MFAFDEYCIHCCAPFPTAFVTSSIACHIGSSTIFTSAHNACLHFLPVSAQLGALFSPSSSPGDFFPSSHRARTRLVEPTKRSRRDQRTRSSPRSATRASERAREPNGRLHSRASQPATGPVSVFDFLSEIAAVLKIAPPVTFFPGCPRPPAFVASRSR